MTKQKYIKPPRSEDCVWRSGPPPDIGWWPADWGIVRHPETLRWWDGKEWSCAAVDYMNAAVAAEYGGRYFPHAKIKWTDRWWEKK